ncbi:MAG: hypothetical protein K0R65_28 [Crocinitomicaceae bacterium]|nr:hypothetical protein [Crocinitomicaceae bacterium]
MSPLCLCGLFHLLAFDVESDDLKSRVVFLEMERKTVSFSFALVVGDCKRTVLVFLAFENKFEIYNGMLAEKILQNMGCLLVAVDAFFAQNGDQKLVVAHPGNSVSIFFLEGRFNLGVRHVSRCTEGYHHERKDSKYKFHTPKLAKIIP